MNECELEMFIENANEFYYNKSVSLIEDFDYDMAKDELRRRFPDNKILKTIGYSVENSEWKKANHIIPMGSLNKINTFDELKDLIQKWGVCSVCIEEKLDGISVELVYKDGILVQGITRGDGYIGEDITKNVVSMSNVKSKLDNFSGSLRGEIVLLQEDFERINEIQKKIGEKPYKNKRNAASGIAKNFDGKYSRYLTIIYYDIICDKEFKSEFEKITFISKELKLRIPNISVQDFEFDDMVDYYNDYIINVRPDLEYDIDGIVIKIQSLETQKKLGEKDLCPKGQIAWKFPNFFKKTILRLVDWQLGITGRFTPVAIFDPINIGGVTITRASLSNLEIFNKFNLHEGDEIIVARMNDVIPNVIKNNGGGTITIGFPTICPYCLEPLKITSNFITCTNEFCEGNEIGNLKKWANYVFEEKGFAGKTIELLYEFNLVKEPADFYKLKIEDLLKLPKFGNRKAEIVLNVINEARTIPLQKFIGGLNFTNFGESRAELLINKGYDSLDKLLNITNEQMCQIEGIGNVIANSFQTSKKNKETIIKHLLEQNINIIIVSNLNQNKDGLFKDKVFVFTGAIQKEINGNRLKRSDMEKLVIDNGGSIGSINKNCSYLVQADPNSSSEKTKKAKELGIEILSEDKFFQMLGL